MKYVLEDEGLPLGVLSAHLTYSTLIDKACKSWARGKHWRLGALSLCSFRFFVMLSLCVPPEIRFFYCCGMTLDSAIRTEASTMLLYSDRYVQSAGAFKREHLYIPENTRISLT